MGEEFGLAEDAGLIVSVFVRPVDGDDFVVAVIGRGRKDVDMFFVVTALESDGRTEEVAIGGRLIFVLLHLGAVDVIPRGVTEAIDPGRVRKIIRHEKNEPETQDEQEGFERVAFFFAVALGVEFKGIGEGAVDGVVQGVFGSGLLMRRIAGRSFFVRAQFNS
jgi:hypothetical protein